MLKGVVHDFPEIVNFQKRAFLTSASCLVAAELKSEFLYFHSDKLWVLFVTCMLLKKFHIFDLTLHLRQIVGLISNLQLSAVKTHRHQDVLLKERVIF